MKEYSFIEMLQEYENGYNGEFKRISDGVTVLKTKDGDIRFMDCLMFVTKGNMISRFIKLLKSVSREIAINQLEEGKTIQPKNSTNKYKKGFNTYMTVSDLLNNEWYVLD